MCNTSISKKWNRSRIQNMKTYTFFRASNLLEKKIAFQRMNISDILIEILNETINHPTLFKNQLIVWKSQQIFVMLALVMVCRASKRYNSHEAKHMIRRLCCQQLSAIYIIAFHSNVCHCKRFLWVNVIELNQFNEIITKVLDNTYPVQRSKQKLKNKIAKKQSRLFKTILVRRKNFSQYMTQHRIIFTQWMQFTTRICSDNVDSNHWN